ncbi:prolyl oligopeptidase family serine peptidase [Tritonibacter mobilis]|uniref:Peptidase S9 prolyl oligopeptidase catalytic domain-containing protein n=2 Tax=Tritonibacter mobilis TaxID=379347 RepID=A0A1B1A730_9RHOB|nr:prolyl oligopeptidase family serine peptidase [Tritonibacter mobilis]ANP42384.1 hypothetical protein K529_016530 [Tritonibacter mobilis F1926]KJZ22692.1 hypothetical protein TW79_17200 [Tritonibacter mobilis]
MFPAMIRKRPLFAPALVATFALPLLAGSVQAEQSVLLDTEAYEYIHQIDAITMSQDGSSVYAVHAAPGTPWHIVRIPASGGEPTEVFGALPGNVGPLQVAPDDTQLAFTFDQVGDERWKLHIVDLEHERFQVVTPEGMLDMPCTYAPDGNAIYSARGSAIWGEREIVRVDTETGDAETIYSEPQAALNCLDLSPDGQSLLLSKYISNELRHLGLFDLETGAVDWFAEEDANASGAFFHDGFVYFTSTRDGGTARAWQWVPGGEIEPVSLPIEGRLNGFVINRAGLLLVSWRDALQPRTGLFKRDAEGGWTEMQLAPGGTMLSGVSIPKAAALPIVFSVEDGSPPIFYGKDDAGTHLLLDTDASGLPDSAFANYESVLFESFDGTKIPTHILKPAQASTDNPLPMVLYVHGGPEDHVDPTYSAARQAVVNAGFVAVLPNVRGSSGFGQDYADMDDGDWGGAHIRDLLAVADHAAELDYIADRPRFIMGGSFGGFSVLSTITQYPDAFDGAVDLFGISDIESFVAGLPAGVTRYFLKEIGFDPADDPERARAMSPLYAVDRIKTPLQIHQGIHDPRVPVEQSREIVEALTARGADVRYFEYEAGHGFASPNDNHMSQQRMIEFFRELSQ